MAGPYDTPAQIMALAEPDPEFAEFLANNPQPNIELTHPVVQAIRQQTLAIEQKRTADAMASGRNEEIRTITMRDGYENEIRIHRPKTPAEQGQGSPLVVLIYGGGFFLGNNLQMGRNARALTDLYGAVVVCISYRLAPEHPWPNAQHDGWDSLVWIAANASSLGADTDAGFVVGGASAGGNIAGVIVQKSLSVGEKDKLAAPVTGLWMDIPVIFARPENVPVKYRALYLAAEQNEDAPGLLTKQAIQYIRSTVKADGFSPDFSPVNAENAHVGMPRTFLQVAGMDMYRDDALIYHRMLREVGVQTRLRIYPGVPHGHAGLYPGLRLSKVAKTDTIDGLGWLLGREVEREEIGEVVERVGG